MVRTSSATAGCVESSAASAQAAAASEACWLSGAGAGAGAGAAWLPLPLLQRGARNEAGHGIALKLF